MKTLKAIVVAAAISAMLIVTANAAPADPQVVPKTKHYSKKVYRGGRKVTVVTYRHGKKITKKVYRKSSHITKKSYHKTKKFIMGPSKKTP